MQKILLNLALIDLINFCKKNNFDCSGSHIIKQPRKWTYNLILTKTKKIIASVTFHTNQIPTYTFLSKV